MKVACVLIPHLRALVELRRRPHLKCRPVVIVDRSNGRPAVADFLPEGTRIRIGMPLEQAMSLMATRGCWRPTTPTAGGV